MRKIKRFFWAVTIIAIALGGVFLLQRHYVINDWIAQHHQLAEIESSQLTRFVREWSSLLLSITQHDVLNSVKRNNGAVQTLRDRQAVEMTFLELYRVYQPFIHRIRFVGQSGRETILVADKRVSRSYKDVEDSSFFRRVFISPPNTVMIQPYVDGDLGLLEIASPVTYEGQPVGVVSMVISLAELANSFSVLQKSELVSNIYFVDMKNNVLTRRVQRGGLADDSVLDVIKRIKTLSLVTPIYQIDGDIWVHLAEKDMGLDILFQVSEYDIFRRVVEHTGAISAIVLMVAFLFYIIGRVTKINPGVMAPVVAKETAVSYTSSSVLLQRLAMDLREPLTHWLSTLRLLSETHLTPQQMTLVDQSLAQGKWQVEQLDRVVDYAESEQANWKIDEIDFDFRHLLQEVAAMLRARGEGRHLRCFAMVHAFVPNRLRGDPTRLRQLLSIVWQSLTESVAKGELGIEVKLQKLETQSALINIEFVALDYNFVGIARTNIAHLVDLQSDYGDPLQTIAKRFFQRLLDQFEMKIEINEVPNSKTILTLQKRWQIAALPNEQAISVDFENKRTLLASENRGNRSAIQRVLQNIGLRGDSVEHFSGVIDRIRHEQEKPYDLTLFDITSDSEVDSALVVARQLKDLRMNNDENLQIPSIIMLVHKSQPGEGLSARVAGVDAYLTKPITRTQLKTAIGRVLAKTHSEGTAWITRHSLAEDDHTQKARVLLLEPDYEKRVSKAALISGMGFKIDVVESSDELIVAIKRDFYNCILVSFAACGKRPFDLVQTIRAFEENFAQASGQKLKSMPKSVIVAFTDEIAAARMHVTPNGLDDVLPAEFSAHHLERMFKAYQIESVKP